MSQVAIDWCIAKGAIPIFGAKNIAAKNWQLDSGEVTELDRAAAKIDQPLVQNVFQTR